MQSSKHSWKRVISEVRSSTCADLVALFGEWISEKSFKQKKPSRNRIFSPWTTFWAFLWQVLHMQASCSHAVAHVLSWRGMAGLAMSPNTAAYCKARQRLSLTILRRIHRCLRASLHQPGWLGRRVKVIDGSSLSMPDTSPNQRRWPQPVGQKKGCGFPVLKWEVVFCLHTGAMLDWAVGKLKHSERKLFYRLWKTFTPGDILLADRFYGSYGDLAKLKVNKMDGVFRLHQNRKIRFPGETSLGHHDALVTWEKPKYPNRVMSQAEHDLLPPELTVRVLQFPTEKKGFRTQKISLVTTLLDPKEYPKQALAELYKRRWDAELHLRTIKAHMGMDPLKCKTPVMIEKEIHINCIAYNLVRLLIVKSTQTTDLQPIQISFFRSLQLIVEFAPRLTLLLHTEPERIPSLTARLLQAIAKSTIPPRPGRTEPRARKRRPIRGPYGLLNQPRHLYKEIPHRSSYSKSLS
ncbi:MAG: IS4 family transposase [Planctomycetota bacterium]|jgi:hypothetical protein